MAGSNSQKDTVKAPRSLGCRTCVKRRIRCDQKKPICGRCALAGLGCDGAKVVDDFQIHTKHEMQKLAVSKVQVQEGDRLHHSSSRRKSHTEETSKPFGTTIPEGKSQLSAYDETLFYTFFLDNNFASTGPDGDWQANKGWMSKILLDQRPSPVTAIALRCLCISFFGRIHRYSAAIDAAMVLYGQSLNALSRKLNEPREMLGFDTLAATSILNYCEHVNFFSHVGWTQHSQGLARIMELCGPKRFLQQPYKSIFAMNRPFLLIEAYRARRRTFLEQEKWLNIIAPTNPDLAATEKLTSIATKLPGLTEDLERLLSVRQSQCEPLEHQIKELESIKAGLYSLQRELQSWQFHWRGAPHHLPTEQALIQDPIYLTRHLQNPCFPTILVYESLDVAATTVQWNAYMIAVLKRLDLLHELEQSASLDIDRPSLLDVAEPFAWDICRSVDYHLQGPHAYQGGHWVIFGALQALAGLSPQSPVAEWLKRVLRGIAKDSGFAIAEAMLEKVFHSSSTVNQT